MNFFPCRVSTPPTLLPSCYRHSLRQEYVQKGGSSSRWIKVEVYLLCLMKKNENIVITRMDLCS